MEKLYTFERHLYAPELNQVYLNGVLIPNMSIPPQQNYREALTTLRTAMRPGVLRYRRITYEHTGATEPLPPVTVAVGGTIDALLKFLKNLRERSQGVGYFLQDDGSSKDLEYGYKITRVQPVNL